MRREIYLVNEERGTFFRIERDGQMLRESWGRLGQLETRGQLECRSEARAAILLESRVHRRVRRGYVAPAPSARGLQFARARA
jgi:predicted DNA-binding WGR domain protein